MRTPFHIIAAACVLGLTGAPLLAHEGAVLDAMQAPHGGQLRMAGIYHYELVVSKDSKDAKDNPVAVYVTDHAGAKIPTAGATGTATLLVGKQKTTVTLSPDGENRLKGTGKYASDPGMKAIVAVTLAGKPVAQARFTPLAQDGHSDHKH